MVLSLDKIENDVLTFLDDENKEHLYKLKDIKIKPSIKFLKEGYVYETLDFKDFNYNKEKTNIRKEKNYNLQRQIFDN
ncbi:MAG: hypothetical protein ACRCZK_01485 [Oscillospiraceae bacterium]